MNLGEEKLQCVADQLSLLQKGAAGTIGCPYCGELVKKDSILCCDLLAKAITAIMDASDVLENLHVAAEIKGNLN